MTKSSQCRLHSPISSPVCIPTVPFHFSSLPITWEIREARPNILGTYACVGDLEQALGSYLLIDASPAAVVFWVSDGKSVFPSVHKSDMPFLKAMHILDLDMTYSFLNLRTL